MSLRRFEVEVALANYLIAAVADCREWETHLRLSTRGYSSEGNVLGGRCKSMRGRHVSETGIRDSRETKGAALGGWRAPGVLRRRTEVEAALAIYPRSLQIVASGARV